MMLPKRYPSEQPLAVVHRNMTARCANPNATHWARYGGRGIYVSDAFQDRAGFIAWALANGWAPGLYLDRIDNDGPYSPENCRFVTQAKNMRNTSRTRRVADGRVGIDAAAENGISVDVFHSRLFLGWSEDEAAGLVERTGARCGPRQRVLAPDGRLAVHVAAENGIGKNAFRMRLRKGWSIERAMTVPAKKG